MAEEKKRTTIGNVIHTISTIVSWTIFVLLILCAIFLTYYYISARIYAAKGSGHEPKYSLYTIISPSMTPNIKVYDVVLDTKVDHPEDIKVNDIITFNSDNPELNGNTITHRVIAITQDIDGKFYYQTKGDANLVEDSSLVPFNQVVGKVAIKIPQLGRVQFFLASSFGWLIVIVIPALYIIIKDILKLLRITGKDDNKNNKDNISTTNEKESSNDNAIIESQLSNETSDKDNNILPDYVIDDNEDDDLPQLKEETSETNNNEEFNMAIFEDNDDDDDDLPSLK